MLVHTLSMSGRCSPSFVDSGRVLWWLCSWGCGGVGWGSVCLYPSGLASWVSPCVLFLCRVWCVCCVLLRDCNLGDFVLFLGVFLVFGGAPRLFLLNLLWGVEFPLGVFWCGVFRRPLVYLYNLLFFIYSYIYLSFKK